MATTDTVKIRIGVLSSETERSITVEVCSNESVEWADLH